MSTLMDHARSRVPRLAEAAVDRARLTVVPRSAPKAPRVPFIALVSLLLVAGVVGLLLFNTSMQQASFTGTTLETRAAALDAKEQSLEMRLETLRDPQRLAERAEKLGMVPAGSPAFLRLSDGKVLGKPAPAEPGDSLRISPLPTRKPKSLRPDPVIVQPSPKPHPEPHPKRSAGRHQGRDTSAASTAASPEDGAAASTTDEHSQSR